MDWFGLRLERRVDRVEFCAPGSSVREETDATPFSISA